MKRILTLAWVMFSAGAAHAQAVPAPEIDGTAGIVALGAIGAAIAFIWERRRR